MYEWPEKTVMTSRGVQSTGHRAQGTEHRALTIITGGAGRGARGSWMTLCQILPKLKWGESGFEEAKEYTRIYLLRRS